MREGKITMVLERRISMGPVEILVVEFPGNKFKGEIIPALQELTNNNTIHIIDLLILKKDAHGKVNTFELSDLSDDEGSAFDDLDGEIRILLNERDSMQAAELLEPNSTGAILVFENRWATTLRDAIVNADGRWVLNERIPADVVQNALEAGGQPVT
jgi:hypothetical protein